MNIDIYIYEEGQEASSGILIPWNPAEIEHDTGKTIMASYEILNWGTVEIPAGTDLSTISWQGMFPGEGRAELPFLKGDYQPPKAYHDTLCRWKEQKTPLRLIITNTPINCDVYLAEYTGSHSGGYGDMTYKIKFRGRRTINVDTVKKASSSSSSTATQTSYKTYKIVKGDTLWKIAKNKLKNGLRYVEIYKLNKRLLDKIAKKHGKSSSHGGHWIYPGTKIKLPKQ